MNSEHKVWKDELQSIISKHNSTRVNGKVASHKTQADRAAYLFKFFYDLREMGYAASPSNIKQKHIQAACEYYESKNLSAATLQTYLMHLRVYCRWIGKHGIVGKTAERFSSPEIGKRIYAAQTDKSWSGNGIEVLEKLQEIKSTQPILYMQLLMEAAFGLRCKETICLRPHIHFDESNLHVVDGAKNGKQRTIPIETEFQKRAMLEAKEFVGRTTNRLIHTGNTLKQEISLYYRLMGKFGLTKNGLGVTGHGLRHEFAHAFMESYGLKPPVKGGESGQMNAEAEEQIRLEVSNRLGHNRVGITAAYYGAFKAKKR